MKDLTNKTGFINAVLWLVVLSLVSCVSAAPDLPEVQGYDVSAMASVMRYVDHEAGVVCYGRYGYGLSCLPIKDTLLEVGK